MLHTMYMAGLLHDIGKIGIDDAVLRKPGKLTEAEFEHIKTAPRAGLSHPGRHPHSSPTCFPPCCIITSSGTARAIRSSWPGIRFRLIARILAVADAFDAMSSDRPYRRGMPLERVEELFKLAPPSSGTRR